MSQPSNVLLKYLVLGSLRIMLELMFSSFKSWSFTSLLKSWVVWVNLICQRFKTQKIFCRPYDRGLHRSALPLFTSYNKFLQWADPLRHMVYPMNLIEKIAKRFLKLDIISDLTLESLEKEENYLPLSEIHIGLKCMVLLSLFVEEISERQR